MAVRGPGPSRIVFLVGLDSLLSQYPSSLRRINCWGTDNVVRDSLQRTSIPSKEVMLSFILGRPRV